MTFFSQNGIFICEFKICGDDGAYRETSTVKSKYNDHPKDPKIVAVVDTW